MKKTLLRVARKLTDHPVVVPSAFLSVIGIVNLVTMYQEHELYAAPWMIVALVFMGMHEHALRRNRQLLRLAQGRLVRLEDSFSKVLDGAKK